MLIKQGGAGGGVDAGNRPNITFDGKWSGWYVDFYGEKAYWEAVFYTSGTLSVKSPCVADAWAIGAGGHAVGYATASVYGRRGSCAQANGLSLSGGLAVTIGAGVDGANSNFTGGTTSLGSLVSAAGGDGKSTTPSGTPYRFADPDKAGEQGENGAANGSRYGLSQGGWMHWRTRDTDGAGYGAGVAYETTTGTSPDMAKRTSSHSGALVLRIAA